ncbi:MAG TPA: molybdate ABC transporter substrate-binding protein [Casimicrobiaceae bacterium]|jgi:molybdate transport system substrate-binding protein
MRNIRLYIAVRKIVRHWGGKVLVACVALAFGAAANCAEMVVSAAISLSDVFREIGKDFVTTHAGTTIAFNFAATDVLLAQISKGAPADVFAAADEASMDGAEQEGLLLQGSRHDFAANRLVLIVPSAGAAPTKLDEIALPRFARIAMGSPRTVPAGRYAKAALEQAGLWDKIEPRCVFALNVRQVLDYVLRGDADAGFVYATDAAIMRDKVKVALDVPTPTPVRNPVAVVRASRHPGEALAFVESLRGPPARDLLAKYGFAPP